MRPTLPSGGSFSRPAAHGATVLIVSADAVGAALLGVLIETLGYLVQFGRPPEGAEQGMRRARPKVCLIDCDPVTCNGALMGRARMRGVTVIIFGTPEALDRVRALAVEHDIDMLRMPADASVL